MFLNYLEPILFVIGPNHPIFWGEEGQYQPNSTFPPGYPQPRFDPIHPTSIDPMGGRGGGRRGGRGRGGRGARLFPGEPDPDNLFPPQSRYDDDDDLYS